VLVLKELEIDCMEKVSDVARILITMICFMQKDVACIADEIGVGTFGNSRWDTGTVTKWSGIRYITWSRV
jgi:hypothetical protein